MNRWTALDSIEVSIHQIAETRRGRPKVPGLGAYLAPGMKDLHAAWHGNNSRRRLGNVSTDGKALGVTAVRSYR